MATADTTRRAFLRAIPSFAAVASVPACALIAPAVAGSSPDERIEPAVKEIEAALNEKFPGWRVQVSGGVQHVLNAEHKQMRPYCQAVLIYTSSEQFGPEQAGWYRNTL